MNLLLTEMKERERENEKGKSKNYNRDDKVNNVYSMKMTYAIVDSIPPERKK